MIPRVLFVAAEAIPLAKTGGLGDVVTALARGLHDRGIEATVLIPGYPQALEKARGLRQLAALDDVPGGPAQLLSGTMPDSDVPVVLVRNDALFARPGGPYQDTSGHEFADNAIRFGALCHAASRVALGETRLSAPDVLHAHDWHAGLSPLFMQQRAALSGKPVVPSVTTIHNLAFQGNFGLHFAAELGVEERNMAGVEFWGQLSFLKSGLAFSSRVTTVSHSYEEEILTSRFGCGLEGLLNARRDVLSSVPNGIDTDTWNPATDELIPARFTTSDLKGKVASKRGLQQLFGLNLDPFAPVVAQGSRLTGQKMADVAIDALEIILAEHPRVQFVALGSGDGDLERRYREFALRHPGRVGVIIGYDERTAHVLHAGADMLLHGSRFEPFGLTPVYSMRYGTVPIVSRVGGLIDSINDHGPGKDPLPGATGFLFDGDTPNDMAEAIRKALLAFGQPRTWREMQRDGMQGDHGWSASAEQYIDLYRSMTEASGRGSFKVAAPIDVVIPQATSTSSQKKRA